MIGHFAMATTLLLSGIPEARAHYDQAIVLYDPREHRPLATRFGQDVRVTILSWRSRALWVLGCPDAALADVDQALKDARDIDQAASLMFALEFASFIRASSPKSELLCRTQQHSSPTPEDGRNPQGLSQRLALKSLT
jgi:hypothetical protein